MSAQTYLTIAIWSQVISAAVFIAALVYMWRRFIQPVVLAAQQRSNQQIAEAERHRDDAKAALTALQEQIEGAKRDAELIRARAERQAAYERNGIIAEATDSGERLVRNARGELDRARAAARERLRGELLARALESANAGAARLIDTSVNERLVHGFLSSLERSNG